MEARTQTSARLSAGDRREQLLDATKSIAVERGFHSVSIEAVAREAGITRPVVYSHFTDLDGLLEALVERETARALDQLAEILPTTEEAIPDRRQALLDAMAAHMRAAQAEPGTWRLVLMPPEGAPESLRERIAAGRNTVIGHLAAVVGPGLTQASAPPDPELVARMLSAFSDEAIRLLLTDPEHYPAERLLATAEWLLDR